MLKQQGLRSVDLTNIGKAICLRDGLVPDAQDDIQTYYGKLAIMPALESVQLGICVAKHRPYIVNELEQHRDSTELLAALCGSFVVPAAPSMTVDGVEKPDLERAVAIRVEQGEGILFDTGVWHWTPYAVTPECNVLVGFRTDTPSNDLHIETLQSPLEMG